MVSSAQAGGTAHCVLSTVPLCLASWSTVQLFEAEPLCDCAGTCLCFLNFVNVHTVVYTGDYGVATCLRHS